MKKLICLFLLSASILNAQTFVFHRKVVCDINKIQYFVDLLKNNEEISNIKLEKGEVSDFVVEYDVTVEVNL